MKTNRWECVEYKVLLWFGKLCANNSYAMVHGWQGKCIKWKSKDNNVKSLTRKTRRRTNQQTTKKFFFYICSNYYNFNIKKLRDIATVCGCGASGHMIISLTHGIPTNKWRLRDLKFSSFDYRSLLSMLSACLPASPCLPKNSLRLSDALPLLSHFARRASFAYTPNLLLVRFRQTADNDNIDKCEEKQQHVCWHKILYQTSSSTRNIEWFPPT